MFVIMDFLIVGVSIMCFVGTQIGVCAPSHHQRDGACSGQSRRARPANKQVQPGRGGGICTSTSRPCCPSGGNHPRESGDHGNPNPRLPIPRWLSFPEAGAAEQLPLSGVAYAGWEVWVCGWCEWCEWWAGSTYCILTTATTIHRCNKRCSSASVSSSAADTKRHQALAGIWSAGSWWAMDGMDGMG